MCPGGRCQSFVCVVGAKRLAECANFALFNHRRPRPEVSQLSRPICGKRISARQFPEGAPPSEACVGCRGTCAAAAKRARGVGAACAKRLAAGGDPTLGGPPRGRKSLNLAYKQGLRICELPDAPLAMSSQTLKPGYERPEVFTAAVPLQSRKCPKSDERGTAARAGGEPGA